MSRHSTDPLSLVAGIVFAVTGGLLLVDRVDLVSRLRWAAPILLIAIALAILGTLTLGRREE